MSEYSIVELIQTINHWHNLALLYVGRAVEDDHEELLEAIKKLIKNQPGVTKEWAEGWALRFTPFPRTEAAEKTHIEQFISMLKEAGVSIK